MPVLRQPLLWQIGVALVRHLHLNTMEQPPRRFWILVYPDMPRPVGGVKQMHRLAEAIQSAGHQAVLVQEDASFHPGWFRSDLPSIDRKSWMQRCDLQLETDVVILAETFLPLLTSLQIGIPKILFNQNGAYSFGVEGSRFPNPTKVLELYQHPDLKQIWCVSHHDRRLLSLGLGLPAARVRRLVNGIEPQLLPGMNKKWQVSCMPRKNSHHADVVEALLQQQPWWQGWSLKRIENCTHDAVIDALQGSLVFLSFGHPEGFGLPVAEAMACGCAVVGYSGLGGRELFDLAAGYRLGFAVEPGDWLGCVQGVELVNHAVRARHDDLAQQLEELAGVVRQRYSMDEMQRSVVDAIRQLEYSS